MLCLLLLTGFAARNAYAGTDQWTEVRSDHFTIITDAGEKQGRHIVDQFERMRWMFSVLFPKTNVDPALPIVVVAAKNSKSFQALEPAEYLAKGQLSLAGLFLNSPDKYYILLRLDGEQEHPFATIYHEYTHLQFSGTSEWMPLWLFEGLAEFVQNTDIHDKDVQLGQASVNDILFLRQNRLIPLATLFKVDHTSPYYHEDQKGNIFYAQSWALTHYLEVNDRQHNVHQMDTYLALVSQHVDPVIAAQKAFGDLKQLENALDAYIRNGSYMQFTLSSAAAPLNEAAYKVRALTPSESDAARANVLAYVGRKQDAQALIDSALKADPNNALAYETMGYLAFRSSDLNAARKSYARAVQLDSQSYLAHYYFAAISLRDDPSANGAAIESSLRTSIRLNPRFAPAYDQLASYFSMKHEKLDEAHQLNLHAIQLDPTSIPYRMNTASVLANSGKPSDAAAVLKTAMKVAKNPQEIAQVQSMLTVMEQMLASERLAASMSTAQATGSDDSTESKGVLRLDGTVKVITPESDEVAPPKHPTMPAGGPTQTAMGTIRSVHCSYPSIMQFQVETRKAVLTFYNNNYYKIDFSTLGITLPEGMNPCHDIEGLKGKIQYVISSDNSITGQVESITLTK